jgi:hypothetical protein
MGLQERGWKKSENPHASETEACGTRAVPGD